MARAPRSKNTYPCHELSCAALVMAMAATVTAGVTVVSGGVGTNINNINTINTPTSPAFVLSSGAMKKLGCLVGHRHARTRASVTADERVQTQVGHGSLHYSALVVHPV